MPIAAALSPGTYIPEDEIHEEDSKCPECQAVKERERPTRRGGWPGPRKTAWAFKPDPPAAEAVKRYMDAHGLDRKQRGDLTKALNAMLATHPDARPATPDTEETP